MYVSFPEAMLVGVMWGDFPVHYISSGRSADKSLFDSCSNASDQIYFPQILDPTTL